MTSVICADDDKYTQILYHSIFSDRGYKVRVYSDSDGVLKAYQEQPADLLILDIHMPGKSGLDLCREFRRNAETFNVPIIIVSAYDTEEFIVDGLSAGADDYIIKPFKLAELLAKTSAVIKKRELSVSRGLGLPAGCLFAGRYEVMGEIGDGGFSNVYQAKDIGCDTHNAVALKVFEVPPPMQKDQDFMPTFLREAYGLSKLDNPNIVKLYDFGHTICYYYLVMEYLEGKTLHHIVKDSGAMEEDEVALISYEITKALHHLESHKVVHRDIKPINIMIDTTGSVKLIDFGLARNVKDEKITVEGIFKGTPQFAAPEIIRMESDIDVRADIFSLGATLYFAITNNNPFPGRTAVEVFNNRFTQMPTPVRKLNSTISLKFSDLIDRMLLEDKNKRPDLCEIVSTSGGIVSRS